MSGFLPRVDLFRETSLAGGKRLVLGMTFVLERTAVLFVLRAVREELH